MERGRRPNIDVSEAWKIPADPLVKPIRIAS